MRNMNLGRRRFRSSSYLGLPRKRPKPVSKWAKWWKKNANISMAINFDSGSLFLRLLTHENHEKKLMFCLLSFNGMGIMWGMSHKMGNGVSSQMLDNIIKSHKPISLSHKEYFFKRLLDMINWRMFSRHITRDRVHPLKSKCIYLFH